jgi:hypothetical protein
LTHRIGISGVKSSKLYQDLHHVDKLSNEVETRSPGIYRYRINTSGNSQVKNKYNKVIGVKNNFSLGSKTYLLRMLFGLGSPHGNVSTVNT